MGTMTLDNFRDELTFKLGNRGDSGMTAARLNRWINHAYAHMTYPSVHPFDELKATFDVTLATETGWEVGDIDLDTEAGYVVLALRSVHYIDSSSPTYSDRRRRLTPQNIRWFDERTQSTGEPARYVVEGGSLLLDPVPSSSVNGNTLRVRCWRERVLLSGDGDTTVLPDYWDRVLMVGSEALAKIDLEYPDREEVLQRYMDFLNDPDTQDMLEANDWGFEQAVRGDPIMRMT
jgi:hypothetical protein